MFISIEVKILNFEDRVIQARLSKGMKLADLAAAIGTNRTRITNLESKNLRVLPIDQVARIDEVLGTGFVPEIIEQLLESFE